MLSDSDDGFGLNKSGSKSDKKSRSDRSHLDKKRISVESIGKDSQGSDMVSVDLTKKTNKFKPKKKPPPMF